MLPQGLRNYLQLVADLPHPGALCQELQALDLDRFLAAVLEPKSLEAVPEDTAH